MFPCGDDNRNTALRAPAAFLQQLVQVTIWRLRPCVSMLFQVDFAVDAALAAIQPLNGPDARQRQELTSTSGGLLPVLDQASAKMGSCSIRGQQNPPGEDDGSVSQAVKSATSDVNDSLPASEPLQSMENLGRGADMQARQSTSSGAGLDFAAFLRVVSVQGQPLYSMLDLFEDRTVIGHAARREFAATAASRTSQTSRNTTCACC